MKGLKSRSIIEFETGKSLNCEASEEPQELIRMKYKMGPKSWKSSAEIDTESDSDPLLSDTSGGSRKSFGTCMFPDTSETSEFESSRQQVPATGPEDSHQPTGGILPPATAYFFPTVQSHSAKIMDSTIEEALARFKHYSKIKNFIRREDTNPRLYDHGVPSSVFVPYIPGSDQQCGKQSSVITIFSVWNTIIGSSLLTLPWSMEKSGLANGILLVILMGIICLYTSYLLLRAQQLHGGGHADWEVSDLAGYLLGKTSEMLAKLSSFVVLWGALIVYWILMSNFLFNFVDYLYERINGFHGHNSGTSTVCLNNLTRSHVSIQTEIGPKRFLIESESDSLYLQMWNIQTTVPIFLILIIGPLVNFDSASFFTKFNSLGTLSVIYVLTFVLIKSTTWGINVDFNDSSNPLYVSNFNSSFPVLTGMLALALFIHNIIITLMRNNKHQEKNGRDLSIAFALVVSTYLIVGVVFYVAFPLDKKCIEANLLDNFENSDTLTVIARIFLFFQLVTVYPLIIYMLRIQLFTSLMKKIYPGCLHNLLFNSFIIATCVLFAIFLPRIGTIIRFTGAFSGFIYIFTLPCLLHLASLRKRGRLTICSTIFHICIIIFGFANVVAQFIITEQ